MPRKLNVSLIKSSFFKIVLSGVIIVKASSIPIHKKAENYFLKNFKNAYVINLEGKGHIEKDKISKFKNSTVIAIGTSSMKLLYKNNISPSLYVFGLPLDEYYYDELGGVYSVSILPDFNMCIKAIKEMLPQVKRIGLLISSDMSGYLLRLSDQIKGAGLQPVVLVANAPGEGIYALSRATVDLIFTFPNPQILTPSSYKLLLALAQKRNFIIVAPSPQLLQMGGHLSFEIDVDRALFTAVSILKRPGKYEKFMEAPLKAVWINKIWMKDVNFKKPETITLKEIK